MDGRGQAGVRGGHGRSRTGVRRSYGYVRGAIKTTEGKGSGGDLGQCQWGGTARISHPGFHSG